MLTLDAQQVTELLTQRSSDPFEVEELKTTRIVLYQTKTVIRHVLTGKRYKAEFVGTPPEVDFIEIV